MTVLMALQLLGAAGGIAMNGYKLLQAIEAAHPGSKMTPEHVAALKSADPVAHQILMANGADFAKEFGV